MSKVVINPSALSVFNSTENDAKGVFTVKSRKSGRDFTFKVTHSKWEKNDKWYTHIHVEQNYLEFRYLGSFFNGNIVRKKQVVDTPAAQAIAWVLRQVRSNRFDVLDKGVEVMHLGKCLRCNRTLTDAKSIERGLGPVCGGR